MRRFLLTKLSRGAAAVSTAFAVFAPAALACSGPNPQSASWLQPIGASCGSQDSCARDDAGSLAASRSDEASSPIASPTPPVDASSLVDAGLTLDAGQMFDATPVLDAGPPLDAALASDAAPLRTPEASVMSAGLSLRVVGNHLVDASSKNVRLLGVNRSGQEFKCIQGGSPGSLGWGIFDGPIDLPSVQSIASWHANAVRVPLNEDCWLGINGVNPSFGGAAYKAAIESYVSTIRQAGLYVILDLHWNAPGTVAAASQQPMPDADHAVDFWKSVASTFSSNPAVVFDLYNEPFLYGSYLQNSSGDPWDCWLNGCGLNQYLTGGTPYTQSYTWSAVGMQTLVTAIRGVGATNLLMVGGLDWANDLSGWLAHQPQDPQHAIVASWHSYPGQGCSTSACWTSVIAPIALQVPVVTGETGDNVGSATTYVDSFLPWEDSQGISYLGWTWNTWGDSANILIADYAGTPTTDYGQKFHDHLVGLNP
jgi:endoglucanase